MKMNWCQKHRLQWIEETLKVFGFINREHLMRKFEISMPQAAKDFALFQKVNPGRMEYNSSLKRYTLAIPLASTK